MRGCKFVGGGWLKDKDMGRAVQALKDVSKWLGFENTCAYGKALDEEGPFIWDRLGH